ncbi:MAG: hypothetical protein LBM93_02880 [Oscillospiraceae bacterium]|jgi:hypothetical protein|nr:hypothetical protein [Oscillospiraceae bacterium]
MLEYSTFRQILESRYGMCSALSLIGLCVALGTRITLYTVESFPITTGLIGWILFVWMLGCALSANVTSVEGNNFITEISKKINPMAAYHYWSVWYSVLILAIAGLYSLTNRDVGKVGNNVVVITLIYLALFVTMNYQEYCFKNSSKKLVRNFFVSRLFVGYMCSVIGVYIIKTLPEVTNITVFFSNFHTTKFMIGILLIIFGVVAMFFDREHSSLFASLILLLFGALLLLQLPTLLVYLNDPSKVKEYYKTVFLTWQMGAIFGLSLAAGLSMLLHWQRNVR